MDWILIAKLFGILLLVVGNAFFVGSEIALTSARRSRIKQLANMGNKSAKIVQLLHNEPERFYSVTQIGITLVSLALGAIGMVTLTQVMDPGFENFFAWSFGDNNEEALSWAHTISYVFAFIIISFMHVVGGELAPKILAFHKAEPLSLSVAWIINLLHTLMRPIIWVMNHASNGLLWLFGQRDLVGERDSHFSMTGDEIRTILSASEQEGAMDPQLTMMLRGIFDLDDHTARDAMVPRTELLSLPADAKVADALNLFKEERRARFPVYESSVDDIVGIVAMKELLHNVASVGNLENFADLPLKEIMLPPYFVPDTMPLSNLLKDFTNNRRQMAMVLDEFGGTAGLITLEDILEEIVGEYEDEFTPRHRHIKKEDNNHFIINGSVRVTELEPKLNFPFPTGDYVTLGGLIFHELGRVPGVGDSINLEGGRLEVLEMDHHRITQVLFEILFEGVEAQDTGKKPDKAALASNGAKNAAPAPNGAKNAAAGEKQPRKEPDAKSEK
ncbi:MAG: HlyC/CorC family transporter [Gammaproteobacteria bacterium]|nr:HlyC/CorC family transporter [Gammaproteobacteria bacterium]